MGPSTGLFDIGGQRLVQSADSGARGRVEGDRRVDYGGGARARAVCWSSRARPASARVELTEVLALADKSGVRTLFGEAFEYQQTVPFFSLFMATLRADPPVGDAEALRQLGGSADLRYWVVHDLADAIHAAAAQTPLAILLEDIHWADNGTLLALRSLATARPDVAVLWVLTARTGSWRAGDAGNLVGAAPRGRHIMRLAAISADAVADMVQDVVRAKADESLLNLAAKAHGNPFLVSELVGRTRRGGPAQRRRRTCGGHRTRATATFGREYAPATGPALQGCWRGGAGSSGAAGPFSAGLLAAMLDRPPASLMSAVDEAVRADLLVDDGERLRFRHDLLREATRQSLPQSLRRAMERQSASIMLSMGATPAEVATQLARSAEPGDREAIDALREAAHSVGHS